MVYQKMHVLVGVGRGDPFRTGASSELMVGQLKNRACLMDSNKDKFKHTLHVSPFSLISATRFFFKYSNPSLQDYMDFKEIFIASP